VADVSYGNSIMEHTLAYRLWQRPFQEQKFAPVERHNDMRRVRRVLDVGCGPGTNAPHFAHTDYLGIDFNPRYIDYACRRFGMDFVVADLTTWSPEDVEPFDFVFANSFFHHIADDEASAILQRLSTLVAADGFVHVLDLVLPARRSTARLLARWDRGDYARPINEWQVLLNDAFEEVLFVPYELTALGNILWHFVYFKGKPRSRKVGRTPYLRDCSSHVHARTIRR
jgi:SAM-dependent methyltransferase